MGNFKWKLKLKFILPSKKLLFHYPKVDFSGSSMGGELTN